MPRPDPSTRFRAKLVGLGGGCTRYGSGATSFSLNGWDMTPRKAAWVFAKGALPAGTLISTCGTRLCCTVGHMRDVVAERGARSHRVDYGSLDRVRGERFAITAKIMRVNPWLREYACPQCGGPPSFGTCLLCEIEVA